MKKRKFNLALAAGITVAAICLISPDMERISPFQGRWFHASSMTIKANAAEIAEGTCGTELTWKLSDGILTITGTGSMTNWTSYSAAPWDSYKDSITSVVINSGVTSVGNYAFYKCSALKTVSLPEELTSIGNYAFRDCSSLATMKLPESLQTIGSNAFRDCTFLKEVRIPSGVTSVSSSAPFDGCTSLTKVIFGSGMTKVPGNICREMKALTTVEYEEADEITSIGSYAFYNCSALATMTIPDTVVNVENNAFQGCSSLATVTLPESLETIGSYAFRYCTSLGEVRIPSGVTSVSGSAPFDGCTSLTKVIFGSGMTKVPGNICRNMKALTTVVYEEENTITSIGSYAFYNCSALTTVTILDTVVNVENNAFQGCSSLTTVTLPESLQTIGNNAFRDCTSLGEVRIPSGVTSVSGSAPFTGCTALTKVIFGSGMTKVPGNICRNMTALTTVEYEEANGITEIGSYAFYNCSALTTAPIPDTVTNVESYVFYKCSALETVSLPEGLTSIGNNAFQDCSSLTTVKLPESLTTIGNNAFRDCTSLGEVRIPSGVTSVSGSAPFTGCTALTKVIFGSGITKVPENICREMKALTTVEYEEADEITSIGSYAFYNCSALATVTIPDTVTTVGNNAFNNCSALKEVSLPEGLTSIENKAFQDCSSLATVTLPESLTSIGSYAFYSCTSLAKIRIPSEVTTLNQYTFYECSSLETVTVSGNLKNIERYVFYGCSNLKLITFPDSLESISDYAFYNCGQLEEIVLPATLKTLGNYAFTNCSKITSVNLEDTSITNIGTQCFMNCSSIKRIVIPESVDKVNNQAFSGCSSAVSLTIPQGVKVLGGGCFAGCTGLTEVEIPRSVSTAQLSSSQGPFTGCSNLTKVTFAEKMRSVPDYLFYQCDQLTEISLPDTISEIGEYAFYGCTNLQKVNMPSLLYSVGEFAFYNCSKITAADLSYSLESIGRSAFSGCSALKEVSFGEYIKVIPNSCFAGTALQKVVLPYAVSSIESNAFSNINTLQEISIPAGTTSISSSAFNQESLTIRGAVGSRAETYAAERGYTFIQGNAFTKAVLDKTEMTLALTEKGTLSLDIAPFDAVDAITWTSENEEIAKVLVNEDNPAEAVVTGISSGETTITVTAGTIERICKVTVGNYVTGISLSKSYIYMDSLGDTETLTASVVPSDADNAEIVWSSANEKVAVVDDKGNITAVGNGTVRITAATKDYSVKAYCFVTVETEVPAESISISEKSLYLTGGSKTLTAAVTPEGATNSDLVWSSSDTTVATVDQNGVVTAVANGTATITVRTTDNTVSAACTVTVQFVKVPVSGIELSAEEIELAWADKTASLTAEVYPEDADVKTIVWESSDPDVAMVNDNGVITATGGGTTVITAKTLDGGYTASCQVTVICLIDALTLDHGALTLKVGESANLKVTIVPENVTNDEVLWTSSNANIVTVSDTGQVTAVAEGEAYIRCRARDASMEMATCKVTVDNTPTNQEEDTSGENDSEHNPSDDANDTVEGSGETNVVNSGETDTDSKSGTTKENTISSVNIKTPGKVKIKKIVAANKKLKVTWKKLKGVDGYQIQYSANKKFKSSKTVTIKKANTVKKTLKKLKKRKKYFVRVRAYAEGNLNGKRVVSYGKWSAVKKQTTK